MNSSRHSRAFTLLELLVVIGIIALLVGLVLPSLASARESGRSVPCLANLHSLGQIMSMYQNDNRGLFSQAYRTNWPTPGVNCYLWGTRQNPVNRRASWLLAYAGSNVEVFSCPSQPWGTYVPQPLGMTVQTTNYGYNAWCLDPPFWGRQEDGKPMPTKRLIRITNPDKLFVFADSGMYWLVSGVPIFQNSLSLDPVVFPWGPNTTPTTHFRHHGRTQALTVDGTARKHDNEGGTMVQPEHDLGFVGAANDPRYDQ